MFNLEGIEILTLVWNIGSVKHV